MFREVILAGHNLKTDQTINNSGVGKRSHAGLILLNVIDSSTKGFLEILFQCPSCTRENPIFDDGRPDKSCTPMYFGKRRASRIN